MFINYWELFGPQNLVGQSESLKGGSASVSSSGKLMTVEVVYNPSACQNQCLPFLGLPLSHCNSPTTAPIPNPNPFFLPHTKPGHPARLPTFHYLLAKLDIILYNLKSLLIIKLGDNLIKILAILPYLNFYLRNLLFSLKK